MSRSNLLKSTKEENQVISLNDKRNNKILKNLKSVEIKNNYSNNHYLSILKFNENNEYYNKLYKSYKNLNKRVYFKSFDNKEELKNVKIKNLNENASLECYKLPSIHTLTNNKNKNSNLNLLKEQVKRKNVVFSDPNTIAKNNSSPPMKSFPFKQLKLIENFNLKNYQKSNTKQSIKNINADTNENQIVLKCNIKTNKDKKANIDLKPTFYTSNNCNKILKTEDNHQKNHNIDTNKDEILNNEKQINLIYKNNDTENKKRLRFLCCF